MPNDLLKSNFETSLNALLVEARREGQRDAMMLIERALGYLTWQPQTKRARQIVEWIEKDIAAFEKRMLIDKSK